MSSSVKKNYLYNMLYQVFIVCLPIITIPYLSRTLGPEKIGIYNYVLSIITYFSLFGSLGISLYGQREIAYHQDDKTKRSQIFWELFSFKSILMLVSIIIYVIVFTLKGDFALFYRILIIELLSCLFDISWFFQGIELFKKTVFKNFVVKTLGFILILLLIKKPEDLWKYILIYSSCNLVGNLLLWKDVFKYICFPKKMNYLKHLSGIMILFIPQVANEIYTVFDKTMLGLMVKNIDEVGYYGQTQKIIKMLLAIITSIGIVMMPRIAALKSKGENDKIKSYMKKTFSFVFMMSFAFAFGLASIANYFVPFFFGNGYDKIALLMKVMVIIIIFNGMSNVLGVQYLLPLKRQKQYNISIVVGAITNVALNLILIPKLESLGAVIATVFAEFIIVVIQINYVKNDFSIKEYVSIFAKYLFLGLIMFLSCNIVYIDTSSNFVIILVKVIIGVVVYLSELLLTNDEFFYQTCYGILRKIPLLKNILIKIENIKYKNFVFYIYVLVLLILYIVK